MDIFIPIGLGFLINLVVFIISKALKETNKGSLQISLVAFLVVLIASFLAGSWAGMGIGVVSFGMLIFVILAGLITAFLSLKKNIGN